jgi:hypothetical protein
MNQILVTLSPDLVVMLKVAVVMLVMTLLPNLVFMLAVAEVAAVTLG